MRDIKKLQIGLLAEEMAPYYGLQKETPQKRDWIRTIRKALNMTLAQLGAKLDITRQSAQRLEKRELSRGISIKSMEEAANAMDMKLVYALVPIDGSLQSVVKNRARAMATRIVMRTHQNMKLEGQEISPKHIEKAIDELAEELERTLDRSIWD